MLSVASRFLNWFDTELMALRKRAGIFAQKHPKIAARLRMTPDAIDDPHTERIVQSFAYTAARIRQKLDDDFPELTNTLLEALYPQYLAQIPSMSIMKFTASDGLGEVIAIEPGFAVDTEPLRGDRCRFRTTQQVRLAPLKISASSLHKPPFVAPQINDAAARACLTITLEKQNTGVAFADLDADELVFFIKAPFATATKLYELLLNRCVAIAIGEHADDQRATRLPLSQLTPVGFEDETAMLPFPKRSFPGFRLLTEFFALPEKYLFFRLSGIKGALARIAGSKASIFFYLDANVDRLLNAVDANSFDLHCTPVINLFPQRAEPIHIDQTRHEYDIIPDARRNSTREVHSIERVTVSDHEGKVVDIFPFFGRKPSSTESRGSIFWMHKRLANDDQNAFTSQLSLVDLSLKAATSDAHSVATVSSLCINRGLPEQLPFGGGQPFLTAVNKNDLVAKLSLLLPPTPTARLDGEEGSYWRLISSLSLNHLPITGGDPELLRDILRLYDFRQAQETSVLIDAITSIDTKSSTARLSDGSIAKGVDITITFDDTTVDRGLALLFGSVLSHFLGLYASINTFSRLTIKLSGTVLPIVRFPPRTAAEVLI
nr:type VI secretion system baseplate subunit TssF [Mesorhizobium sp. IRAMC:0171]